MSLCKNGTTYFSLISCSLTKSTYRALCRSEPGRLSLNLLKDDDSHCRVIHGGTKWQKPGENSSAIMFPVKFEFMILIKWPKLHEIFMAMSAEVGADL